MQNVQALQRSPLIEVWRERSPLVIAVAVALLLAIGLFALVWTIIHSPDPIRPEPTLIQLSLVAPAPLKRPAEPARETVRKPQAPPPKPVPPKKLVEHRRDSVAAAPALKPAPPQPKTRAPAVADPLSLDAPPDWRQFGLPKGANAGNVIGGDGANGGGSGCGGSTFWTFLDSQLQTVFKRDEKVDSATFRIQARLWFDDQGTVQRSQLVQSSGKADLDASIKTLLGQIDVGRGMPQCIQPITIWVSQPADGVSPGVPENDTASGIHMQMWQNRTRKN
jgi:periplasmic protein TonB